MTMRLEIAVLPSGGCEPIAASQPVYSVGQRVDVERFVVGTETRR